METQNQQNKVSFLTKENDLNKILDKRDAETVKILFLSIWDTQSDICNDMIAKLRDKEYENCKVYVMNSFDTPRAFMTFKVTKTPTLVTIRNIKERAKVTIESYPAMIYKELAL